MSGLWCVNIGYGRNELADAAARQMRELPFYNSFFKSAHPPAIELSRLLAELTPPQFNRVFFTQLRLRGERHDRPHDAPLLGPDGPAEAQRDHQPHQRLSRQHDGGREPRRHGGHARPGRPADSRTSSTSSSPTGTRTASTLSPGGIRPAGRAAAAEKIEELGPERVAAFIGEPMQGAGGVIVPPSTYWPEIQRICREYDILLICRRSDLRLRPHRPLVRLRALRRRAGLHDDREGHHLRLPAARRRDGLATAWPTS